MFESGLPRVLILAGAGPYPGNAIAQQIDDLGAYAFKTLRRRGYEPQDILYLSAFANRDADGDGLNDVDDSATLATLEDALTGEFAQEAGRLMVILISHGHRTDDFMAIRVNEDQVLPSTTLDAWLDDLQTDHAVDVTLVVDTCYSGQVAQDCAEAPEGRQRIAIASTSATAEAVFLPSPDLTSFVYTFLSSAYMGNSMGEAWRAGKRFFEEFPVGYQVPQLVDSSMGTAVADREFFGATWVYGVQSTQDINRFFPAFDTWMDDTLSEPGEPVRLWTRLLPGQKPNQVVAVLRPPAPAVISGDPVTSLPHVYLSPKPGDPRLWEATASGTYFEDAGPYVVSFSARFDYERVSNPVFSRVTVSEGVDPDTTPIRAILAIGETGDPLLSDAFKDIGPYAYSVYLDRFQDDAGVKHPEWIEYFTPFPVADRDGTPSSAAVLDAIDNLPAEIGRLYVHLVGTSVAPGEIELAPGDVLTAGTLDAALDDLQLRQTCAVVLVVDAPFSGAFLPVCARTGGQERVVLAGSGAGETALFVAGPIPNCFSQKYLAAAYQGNHLRNGFRAGREFFKSFLRNRIRPQLDDNGDGVSDKYDGELAERLYLGRRYAFAGDEASDLPFVIDVTPEDSILPPLSDLPLVAQLVEGVTPTRVFAQVVPDGIGLTGEPIAWLDTVEFARESPEGWTWAGTVQTPGDPGVHAVAVYAAYRDEATSEKVTTPVFAWVRDESSGPDAYEVDDTWPEANLIVVQAASQSHTIHTVMDEDWVYFDAVEGRTYTIAAQDVGADLDVGFELYEDGDPPVYLDWSDDEYAGGDETWTPVGLDRGRYWVRVYHADPESGAPTEPGYQLSVVASTGVGGGEAVAQSASQIRVTWWTGASSPERYQVWRSETSSGPYEYVDEVAGTLFAYDDGGLAASTQYYYFIRERVGGVWGQLTLPFDATTWPPALVYVDDDGPDNGVDRFDTIAEGVAAVPSGGTVVVNEGTYAEQVTVTKPLTLMGSGSAIMNGSGLGAEPGLLVASTGVTIAYLRIQNYQTGIRVGAAGHATIHHCNFANNTVYAVENLNTGATISAENCWWGKASGP